MTQVKKSDSQFWYTSTLCLEGIWTVAVERTEKVEIWKAEFLGNSAELCHDLLQGLNIERVIDMSPVQLVS